MADSDDEYDRRRGRDKFRRERNDYDRRDERRRESWDHDRARSASTRSRDVWSSRNRDSSKRDSYGRDYDSRRRDRYSPPRHDMSPPQMKRMRRDWDDGGVSVGTGGGGAVNTGSVAGAISGGGAAASGLGVGVGVGGVVGVGGIGGVGGAAGVGRYDMHYNAGTAQIHGAGPPHPTWGAAIEINLPLQNQPHYGNSPGQNRMELDYPTQPPMLTFKQFLSQQDDSISDHDAIKKYNEYKMEFKKGQITEFFLAHKDEEWFKYKYHPEECSKRQEEQHAALRRRLQIFLELLAQDRVSACSVEVEKSEELIKLLDAAVIKLEGGDDTDLKILDEPESPEKEDLMRNRNNSETQQPTLEKKVEEEVENTTTIKHSKSPEETSTSNDKNKENTEKTEETKEEEEEKKSDQTLELPITKEQEELQRQAQEFSKQQQDPNPAEENAEDEDHETKGKKKRHRDKTEYSYETGSESESGSDSEPEPAPPGVDDPPAASMEDSPMTNVEESKEKSDEEGEDGEKSEEGEGAKSEEEGEGEEKSEEEEEEGEDTKTKTEKETKSEEKDVDTAEDGNPNKSNGSQAPRALHKTCSIFLRNLAPSITKQEVIATCRRYPGFMRVALQDPQPERRFFRRGWVTFERNVNIKEICWNLNNIRLRDCELGAIVNRELKQRVRPVHGITAHKPIVKQDIKLTTKIIQNLDAKWKLWEDIGEEKKDAEKSYGLVSKNPVLKNITDYLVEEGSYEEEELLGENVDEKDKPKEGIQDVVIEKDSTLLSVLDRMILYLRIVHSLDYYSASEYPNEDEMPHRCGIIHGRGSTSVKITQNDVTEWMANFETKLKNFVEMQDLLNKDEANQLGRKDPDLEVEKFVTSNTQELAKDKWLCPLSGKKFKGPDYVKKHIFNKHGEKIEEVKKEVSFFNNYLLDPKRPQLPEHPGNKQTGPSTSLTGQRESLLGPGNPSAYQGLPQMLAYNQPRPPLLYAGPPTPYGSTNYARDNYRLDYRRGGGGGGGGGGYSNKPYSRRPDPRSIIEYRDLDAPDDVDIF